MKNNSQEFRVGAEKRTATSDRVYSNAGNAAILALVDPDAEAILDVGCGAGDNARVLMSRRPETSIDGITHSQTEANAAERYMRNCWVTDLEDGLPAEARENIYDVVILSHVLEHLSYPAHLVAQVAGVLKAGGTCLIAVPNVLAWQQRLKFLAGRFEYESAGTMDETHLRFFTYRTAARYLFEQAPALKVEEVSVTGAMPLWVLRRYLLPSSASRALDTVACKISPNLFGSEVLIKAVKQ